MQIAFNPQYLLDGISAMDSDTVRISFTRATRPAVITGKGEAQPDYRYVLMPIRSLVDRHGGKRYSRYPHAISRSHPEQPVAGNAGPGRPPASGGRRRHNR